jgi:hypothetical protein
VHCESSVPHVIMGHCRRRYHSNMNSEHKQIAFGEINFWPEAAKRYAVFLEAASNLQQAVSSVVDPAYAEIDRNQHLLINILQLVAVGMKEVVTLVGNGMGHGAMKIVRGMVENAINSEYIRLHPEQGEKYFEWHWVEMHKLVNQLKEISPAVLTQIQPEKLAEDEEHYQKIKDLFRYKVPNSDGTERTVKQDGWCRDNLFERAKKTNTTTIYRTVMPTANQILHGTIGGWLTDMDEGNLRIEYPPTDKWGGEALIAAHGALIQAVESASKALGAEPNPGVNVLEEEFRAAWNPKPIDEGNSPIEE